MKNSERSRSRRLETFPYGKLFTYLDMESAEGGLTVEEVEVKGDVGDMSIM